MSQYFRKLKARWKDPRCRSHGGGRVFLGPDDKVGLRCNRFDLHVDNCKCKQQVRARRTLEKLRKKGLCGVHADCIIIDEAGDLSDFPSIEPRIKQPLPVSFTITRLL